MNTLDSEIRSIMEKYKKFTVYGLSPQSGKPSHDVPTYMKRQGWDPVGTYPKPSADGPFQIYSSLKEVPVEYRKLVDVFRSPDKIPEVVDEILSVGGVEVLWLQLGIANAEAEAKAEAAGIKVISDRCLEIEHKRWF